jgi:hypothetical protein
MKRKHWTIRTRGAARGIDRLDTGVRRQSGRFPPQPARWRPHCSGSMAAEPPVDQSLPTPFGKLGNVGKWWSLVSCTRFRAKPREVKRSSRELRSAASQRSGRIILAKVTTCAPQSRPPKVCLAPSIERPSQVVRRRSVQDSSGRFGPRRTRLHRAGSTQIP